MNDPPVWRQQYKPRKICDKENNETNFKAISSSSFLFLFVLETKKKDKMAETIDGR
jgi:hypothetical protein